MEILLIIAVFLMGIRLHVRRARQMREDRYLTNVDESLRNLHRGGSITWN